MKKHLLLLVTVVAAILACVFMFQTSPASAGGTYPTTTTKVTYPTTTTKVTYPTTTTVPKTTTTREETTTTVPRTTTTVPRTTTTVAQTTTTQEQTTTTVPETTTTEQPNLTILTLAAQVNGGTATLADFDLFANGPVSLSGITDSPGVTFAVVPPGFYALADTQSPLAQSESYSSSGWDCVGTAATTSDSATLDQGEDALCVITFTSQFATTTTTAPGATTTAPGATTTAPTGTTVAPSGSTTPTTVCPDCVTATTASTGVQVVTPATESPILASPAGTTLAVTGSNIRMGLGSGLLLITLGGLIMLLVRRVKK